MYVNSNSGFVDFYFRLKFCMRSFCARPWFHTFFLNRHEKADKKIESKALPLFVRVFVNFNIPSVIYVVTVCHPHWQIRFSVYFSFIGILIFFLFFRSQHHVIHTVLFSRVPVLSSFVFFVPFRVCFFSVLIHVLTPQWSAALARIPSIGNHSLVDASRSLRFQRDAFIN